MTTGTRPTLHLPIRATALSTIRDVLMVALCISLVVTFVADLWRSAPPPAFQGPDPAADVRRPA